MSSVQSLCSMTREETIKRLDELIAYLNICRGLSINLYEIERKVHSTLDGLPVSASTRSAIRNVSASVELPKDVLMYSGFDTIKAERNKKTVVVLIDILSREKNEQIQAMQEEMQKTAIEEQKKGNQIQRNALYVSIVAIIISLVSLAVAICK